MSKNILVRFGSIALLVLFAIIPATITLLINLPSIIRQSRCKHDRAVHETMSCNVICNDCMKDLGFIGTWSKTEQAKNVKIIYNDPNDPRSWRS